MALTKIPASLLDTSGGFDLQGNITLGDNEQIQLGDSQDLQIYHSGTESWIKDAGTGNLYIDTNGATIQLTSGNTAKNMISAAANGGVTIYHDNGIKINTSSTGATVTGTLTVTGDLDITGNINSYNVTDLDVTDQTITLGAGQTEANSGGSGIIIGGSSASMLWNETDNRFDFNVNIFANNGLLFGEQDFYLYRSAADRATLRVGDSGSYKYFQFSDTGSVARFNSAAGPVSLGSGANDHLLIDSSGRVGIGTSSPDGNLEVRTNQSMTFGSDTVDSITIGTSGTNKPCIKFDTADTTHTNRVWAIENGAGNRLNFFRNGLDVLKLNQDGSIEIPGNDVLIGSSTNLNVLSGTPKIQVGDGSGHASIQWYSGAGSVAGLYFGDASSGSARYEGYIEYRHNSNQMAFRTQGADVFYINSNGHVGVGTSNADARLTVNGSANSEQMIITGNGNVSRGLSISTAATGGQQDATVIFNAQDTENVAYPAMKFQTGGGDILRFHHQSIINNARVGLAYPCELMFNGEYTAGQQDVALEAGHAARIEFLKDDFFRIQGSASVTAGAGVSYADKLKVNIDSGGILFGSDTAAANTLNDYEEGTYTATISCASGSISLNTSFDELRYIKIGNLVHVQGRLVCNGVSNPTGATNLNLPFTSVNDTNKSGMADNVMTGYFNGSAVTNGIYTVYGNIDESSTNCRLFIMLIPATNNLGDNHMAAGSDLYINFTYQAA